MKYFFSLKKALQIENYELRANSTSNGDYQRKFVTTSSNENTVCYPLLKPQSLISRDNRWSSDVITSSRLWRRLTFLRFSLSRPRSRVKPCPWGLVTDWCWTFSWGQSSVGLLFQVSENLLKKNRLFWFAI